MMHKCVKCKSPYEDDEPDDYYCAPCNEIRKQVAAEIDAKHRPSAPVMSGLQAFESMGKTMKSASGGKATFVRASDFLK